MTTTSTASRTAIVFPGMGPSAFAEVGKFLLLDPFARARLAEADQALGTSVFDNFREQTEDYSEFSQVAFLVNSMALADRAEETLGVVPDICVGPSFGQKAAAAYVGSLPFAEAVRLTAELARLEEDFFGREYTDVVTHSFVRTPEERLAEILADFDERGVWYEFSGHLDRGFTMLSLRENALEELKERISKAGGYSMYSMRPPVHAPAFAALRRRAEEEVFSRYAFTDPKLPVVTDQDGTVINSADELRTMMLDTFDRPINWPAVVTALKDAGVSRVCVTGPDNLFHRLDCTKDNFEVEAVGLPKRSRPRRSA
ncbi:ACP S-malonyltransferase [Streptomyces coacervatus]|uniref:[acyl-carrier-protein] S-malonyltransferase n=1 Tax=Streptomyces coacervatus TaxID=647381 RepID=A0ABP7J7E4_9ACTN|nr:acyltransferase domain-containing protein [Streptomyces coacervatus]MDF2269456.1 acyltransferase domain-containing protein [Streptomyces coacervatus]